MFLRNIKSAQSLSPPPPGGGGLRATYIKRFFHFASVKKFNLFS